MDRAQVYSKIKHNTTLLNFIVYFIVKLCLETFEEIKRLVNELISRFQNRQELTIA